MKLSPFTRLGVVLAILSYGVDPTTDKLIIFGVIAICAELQTIEEKL